MEVNTKTSIKGSVVLFKRGSKRIAPSPPKDEENAVSKEVVPENLIGDTLDDTARPVAMTDTFTFSHLRYVIPSADGEKVLLDDVSGFVAPGRLTALMGESGAGKVSPTPLNIQRSAQKPHDLRRQHY